MTEREVLKLALEALKQIDEAMPFPVAKLAQKAIREALAQPEQICGFDVVLDEFMPPNTFKLAQPEHEPVAWQLGTLHVIKKKIPKDADKSLWNPLYANPFHPKRLTDKQIEEIIKSNMLLQINFVGIRNDIEQAHGIKE